MANITAQIGKPVEAHSIYVNDDDRFVVMLVSSYGNKQDRIESVEQAAAGALALTLDGRSDGTVWAVLDRETNTVHYIDQGDFEDIVLERGFIG